MRARFVAATAVLVTLVTSAAVRTPALAHGSTAGEGLRLAGSNPFRGQTAFAFRINHDMKNVELAIFDAKGRRVATLLSGNAQAGDHRVVFAADGLASGNYIVHLKTEHGVYNKHLVVRPTQ